MDSQEVERKIKNLQIGVKNFSKPLNKIGNDLLEIYSEDVFKTQGRTIDRTWKPLSVTTLFARSQRQGYYRNAGGGTQPLIWTKRLQKGFRKKVTSDKLVIDNPIPYFKHHQAPTRPGRPPRRQMLRLTSKIINGIMKSLNQFIIKSLLK